MIYAENILICITVPLLISLFFIKGSTRQFIVSFLIGMGVCLLGAYISGFVSSISGMGDENTAIFLSPVIEESLKCLPLLFYLFMFEPPESGLFMAATGIGAGFALFENSCYMLVSGAGNLSFILVRSLAVGVMHIVSLYALAFGLAMAVRFKVLNFPSIAGAVSLSMIFHGLYNLLVSRTGITSRIGYALPVVTAFLLLFIFRQTRIGEENPDIRN